MLHKVNSTFFSIESTPNTIVLPIMAATVLWTNFLENEREKGREGRGRGEGGRDRKIEKVIRRKKGIQRTRETEI